MAAAASLEPETVSSVDPNAPTTTPAAGDDAAQLQAQIRAAMNTHISGAFDTLATAKSAVVAAGTASQSVAGRAEQGVRHTGVISEGPTAGVGNGGTSRETTADTAAHQQQISQLLNVIQRVSEENATLTQVRAAQTPPCR